MYVMCCTVKIKITERAIKTKKKEVGKQYKEKSKERI
jgi:hypothetical protein